MSPEKVSSPKPVVLTLAKILLLVAACVLSLSSIADESLPRVDFMRQLEEGTLHYAIRCHKGTGGDRKVTCMLRKSHDGVAVSQAPITEKSTKALVSSFLGAVPGKLIETHDVTIEKLAGSSVWWKVSDGSRFTQGSLSHSPNSLTEQNAGLENTALTLETTLDTTLIASRIH